MLRRLSFAVALAGALVASGARAQTIDTPPGAAAGGDTLVLKDGTVLHGAISEMTPGKAVTIKLADGSSRTVDWGAVDRVDIDRAKPPPAPAAAAPATHVHLENAAGLELQAMDARSGTRSSWRAACTGACDADLPSSGLYRVDGPGLRTSRSFQLEPGQASYRVERASSAGFAGGLTLLILGGAAALNGVGFIIVGAEWQGVFSNANDFLVGGAVAAGVGVALLVVGVVLMKINGRTNVTPLDGATPPVRAPAWLDVTPAWMPRVSALGAPLLGGTF